METKKQKKNNKKKNKKNKIKIKINRITSFHSNSIHSPDLDLTIAVYRYEVALITLE